MISPCADILLKNYIILAQEITDAASPQDNFLATFTNDWRCERALQGIRLLAQHHVGQLVHSLIDWRQSVNENIKKNFSKNNIVNVHGVCKRGAMEILFLEAAMQVLDEFEPEWWQNRHFHNFFESMQHVAFRWLLNAEEYVPHHELSLVRQHVVLCSSRLVGVISRIRLSDVTNAFVKKLDERLNTPKNVSGRSDFHAARAQILKLCAGMRRVVMTFDSDSHLEQSTRFLQKVQPLNYTASIKKSQVHHALCEMLTDILTPLVRSNQPQNCHGLSPALLTDWYNQVLRLKNEIGQWVNKANKHIMVGYPLVTVLVCLVDNQIYGVMIDSMAEYLAKQMKTKEYRSLCFNCLSQLVTSYLVRSKGALSSPHIAAWLDKYVKPVLASARKGGIPAQEQQEFVSNVADLHPDYCIGSIVPDLLASDSSEAQLIALRVLQLVVTSVPQDSAAGAEQRASLAKRSTALAAESGVNHLGRQMVQLPAARVLDLIRDGQHPCELQGIAHLLPRVQQQMVQLLTQYHRMYGSYLSFSAEAGTKDKPAHMSIFSAVVRLVPYLKPEQWAVLRPLDVLPAYTAHAENTVKASAIDALMGTLRACPVLRSQVLTSMAVFLAAIPDEAIQTTRECLLLLRNLMEAWLSLLQQQRLGGSSLHAINVSSCDRPAYTGASHSELASSVQCASREAAAAAGPSNAVAADAVGLALDLHRLEGALFVLMCSYHESVRCEALKVIGLVRTLFQQLWSVAEQLNVSMSISVQQQQLLSLQQSQQDKPASAIPAALAAASTANGSFSSTSSAPLVGLPESSAASAAFLATGMGSSSMQLATSAASTTSGMFSRHKPSVSKDSSDFLQTLGQLETPGADVICLMDVFEEVGSDAACRCYWDFGDWSDLWRDTKHVPTNVTLQTVMAAGDEVGQLRWMRCLVELTRCACHMCPTSMGVGYLEMLHKLSRHLGHDSAGRLVIPAELMAEGHASEAWRPFVVVACVCPPSLRDAVERAAARKGTSLPARDVIRSLLATMTGTSSLPQQICLLALGHANPEHYPVLFEELPVWMDEYQRPGKQRRGNIRPEEARKVVANVMRLIADAMPDGTLASQPVMRGRFLNWLRETILYLRTLPPFDEAFWDVSQVAYCLCAVCRSVAGQLVNQLTMPLALLRETPSVQRSSSNKSIASDPSTPGANSTSHSLGSTSRPLTAGEASNHQNAGAGSAAAGQQQPMTRKMLFQMFAAWSEEGQGKGHEYHSRRTAGINVALASVKDYDGDVRESLRQELAQNADLLDQAARLAMAAMLQGPVFDTDARRAQGPVLSWIDRLLQAPRPGVTAGRVPCVPKDSVGRMALFNLLRSNLDMFSVCVDRCYDRDQRIATGSFQVVSEVYALSAVKVEPHVVLSLVLYKMVDSNLEVREDALHMLHVLSMREWQAPAGDLAAAAAAGVAGGLKSLQRQQQQHQAEAFALEAEGGSGTVVVLGALQDSYQQFQFQLAVKLARDHPELSEALCEEMMTRQLELADKVSQHPVLTCLSPWMENLTVAAHWKGTWCERLLKSMYYVTLRHGDELPLEIERLWSTLAANRRNIIPILDFLASLGTHIAYQELTAMLEYLGVSKRICLYLARISPQQTIDHLVYEISLQLHEEEGAAAGGGTTPPGYMLGSCQQRSQQPLSFASVLLHDTSAAHYCGAAHKFAFDQQQQASAAPVAEPSGALHSSAGSWWATSSTSSLASLAVATNNSYLGPGSTLNAVLHPASVAAAGSAGMLGGQLQHSPSTAESLLGPSFPSGGPSVSNVNASFVSQASSSIASAWGLPSGASAVESAAGPVRHSVTDASDISVRSSLSATGQNSSKVISLEAVGMAAGGALGLPRPINTGRSGQTNTSSELLSAAAGGGSGFNLSSYFAVGTAAAAAGSGSTSNAKAGGDRAAAVRESDTAGTSGGRQRSSMRQTQEPASPVLRGIVTRPELALCLLTEVAYEHDEDFTSHLPLLCHICLLLVDSEEALVAAAAQQLLVNCLYSLSARHLEVVQEDGRHVECLQATHLIKYLQSMKGRRLWAYEDITLEQQQELPSAVALAGMVHHCLNALSFMPDLHDGWCGVALEWALHARNRHLACRSQQVIRALQPPLTNDICSTLLTCLQQCLAAAGGCSVACEVALELLLTLGSLLEALPPHKLLLYPQVFWLSVSLLLSGYVHMYQPALILLSKCLVQLPLWDSTTQNLLLAAAPVTDPGDMQQLLMGPTPGLQRGGLAAAEQLTVSMDSAYGNIQRAASTQPAVISTAGPLTARDNTSSQAQHGAQHLRSLGAPFNRVAGSSMPPAVAVDNSVASSIQSFLGGADADNGARPMRWALAQHLPWSDNNADGPAHQLLAVQQLLFKGLLFQDTQLPTVQLFTLLAQSLCELPSAAATPVQSPSRVGKRVLIDKDSMQQGTRPSSRVAPGIGQANRSRVSGVSAGSGVLDAATRQQQGNLGVSGPNQQIDQQLQQQQQSDATMPVWRSAPEMQLSTCSNRHSHSLSSSAVAGSTVPENSDMALQQPLPSPSAAAAAHADKYGTRKASRVLTKVGAVGVSSSSSGSSSGIAAWCSVLHSGSGAGSGKQAPGSKAVFQYLLGHRHAQLLVSIASVVPFFCSQAWQLEPGLGLLEALQECMSTLSAACCSQGLHELGSRLQQLGSSLSSKSSSSRSSIHAQQQQQSGQQQQQRRTPLESRSPIGSAGLVHQLQSLCLQLSRALLPTMADWLLRFWVGVLLLPGATALHPHILLLLRCLFDTPGLQLGSGAALLLDSAFIRPIVNLSQGHLCQCALEALDAIMHFAASSAEVQRCSQQRQGPAGLSSMSSSAADVLARSSLSQGPIDSAAAVVDLQGLIACLLPQLDVVELLQRVLESCSVPAKRRKYQLLPFISELASKSSQQVERPSEQ